MIALKDFVKVVDGEFISGDPHALIRGVSTDTRTLGKGDCFFAIKGTGETARDGHDFIKDAVIKDASVIVFSKDDISIGGDEKILLGFPALVKVKDTLRALGDYAKYVRSHFGGKVICVVGSNGKTTVKNMIYSILVAADARAHKSPRNYNNLIGLPLTILSMPQEDGEVDYLVLEAGISVAGEMSRLGEIAAPDIAVITSVGREHLEGLGDMETVFKEETEIFRHLKDNKGIAVINMDDSRLADFAAKNLRGDKNKSMRVVGFSLKGTHNSGASFPADMVVGCENISQSDEGVSFTIDCSHNRAEIFLKLNGIFNVSNALAAAAVCFSLGVPLEKIKQGLESFEAVPGRMQKFMLSNGCVIINDAYNANPDSMRASIAAFMEAYPRRNKILVLGDMLELGTYSRQEHRSLGEFVMTLPFEEALLVGRCMRDAFERMKEIDENAPARHFNSVKELADEILGDRKYVSSADNAVFFKGSHSVGLEDIALKLYKIRALEI